MEYLSFDARTKELELKKAALPVPKEHEVRVRVAYAGICGTDLHIIDGTFPCKKDGPITLGHEFSGTIDAVGSAVTSLKVGQKVVIDPNSGCSTCVPCHDGSYHLCSTGGINSTTGIYKDGGWSTHAVVPETQVHVIPDNIELHTAALTEPLSCLVHGWSKINPVNIGSNVLVIGAGIIGLLWACFFHLRGIRKNLTVSEVQEKRQKIVKNLGLDYQVKSPAELKGEYDVIVDCSGSGPAMEAAVPLLARGGRFCIFGVANPNAKLTINPYQVYYKELKIVGVHLNPFAFPEGIALVQAMSDKYLNFDKLGIRVYPLNQYREALVALKQGEVSKAVFKL